MTRPTLGPMPLRLKILITLVTLNTLSVLALHGWWWGACAHVVLSSLAVLGLLRGSEGVRSILMALAGLVVFRTLASLFLMSLAMLSTGPALAGLVEPDLVISMVEGAIAAFYAHTLRHPATTKWMLLRSLPAGWDAPSAAYVSGR